MFPSSVEEHIFILKTNQNAGFWRKKLDNFQGATHGPLRRERAIPSCTLSRLSPYFLTSSILDALPPLPNIEIQCLITEQWGMNVYPWLQLRPRPDHKPLDHPAWGRGTPFPPLLLPCPFPSSSFALYYFSSFRFLIHFTYFLLLSIRSLSTRIIPLRFQATGRRRRPNLGLVFLFMIVLSVLLS